MRRLAIPSFGLSMALSLCAVDAAEAGVVSDPFRAADVTWPKYELKGRDWRYLMLPSSFSVCGIEDEPFVKDAGVSWVNVPSTLNGVRAGSMFGFGDDPNAKRFVVGEPKLPESVRARLKDVPFIVYEATRCVWGLRHEECDLRVYDRFVQEYPETFLGATFGEWNSRVMYFLPRKRSAHYLNFIREFPMPCSRDQFYRHFLSYWDLAAGQKGPRVIGLSGPCNLAAIGCERGSTLAALELTGEAHCPWRELMMFNYGASRQFGVPLMYYFAELVNGHNSTSIKNYSANADVDWGTPPNLVYRTVLLGYYMGCNYQQFESFPWGFLREVEGKKGRSKSGREKQLYELSGNGLAAKRAYEFIRSPAGARGEFYAPILLIADRAHGHDGLSGTPSVKTGHGPFANEFQPTAADQFFSDLLVVIENDTRGSRPYEVDGKVNPVAEYQFALYNSPFADIFDVAIANPVTPGKELRPDQLAKYPVVISVGGIQWDEKLKETIGGYVERGGTFVYPQGEQELVKKSGHGNVLAMPREPEKMRKMLLQLQKEVLPCSYEGECETVWNVMPDGSWRVCIVNNSGVEKPSNGSEETFHDEFAKTIKFDLPKGATARELTTGGDGPVVVVPPGGVRVLEITGMARHAEKFDIGAGAAAARPSLRTPPAEFPLEFRKCGLWNEDCLIKTDWETDELTLEVLAKPKPVEYWQEKKEKEGFALQGGVFGVFNSGGHLMFTLVWKEGFWNLRREREWIKGPKADPNRYTKLAVTLKDRYLRFFVDDKEVFDPKGPLFWEKGTAKDTFAGCFRFLRGSDTIYDTHKHCYFGEAKEYHAYSKAIYPLKHEVVPSGGDDTAAIQNAIDAAVEKTGEVVLKKGTYNVSQLLMKTGVTLHLEEGSAIVQTPAAAPRPAILAKGVSDFTILGPGRVDGALCFDGVERGCVMKLETVPGAGLVVKDSKNVVLEECRGVSVDARSSSRVLVDGKLLVAGK
ncbi:MAG: hypothetical protein IJG84_16960 [Kiritimatiellae bacterium]|nr:hypothetical protein [Kiritimatiellia bacterium]